MAVFRYTAGAKNREEHTESGIIVAADEAEARAKLRSLEYDRVDLKRLTGLTALLSKFTADIK